MGGFRIAGVSTCVPSRVADNLDAGMRYGETEVRKVVAMAGVRRRRTVDAGVTAGDLCHEAANHLLEKLGWSRDSVTGLIMVTQSPDYLLPSTSCVIQHRLGLSDHCAACDVGMGCSGYPYGLYLAACMLRAGGQQRILVLHGETPSRFTHPDDYATTLLFGDAGSATALEVAPEAPESVFVLHTDGSGYDQLIIPAGGFRDRSPADPRDHFLRMDGGAIFNFTVKRVPQLIQETLDHAGLVAGEINLFLFHQANRFIMKHIAKKCGLPEDRIPITLDDYGNTGGPSVPLTLTQAVPSPRDSTLRIMLLGYGVGLSWGAAVVDIDVDALILHADYLGEGAGR
jgi:3-oxoacyl-[acyl-carrier-protein] synthase-3